MITQAQASCGKSDTMRYNLLTASQGLQLLGGVSTIYCISPAGGSPNHTDKDTPSPVKLGRCP